MYSPFHLPSPSCHTIQHSLNKDGTLTAMPLKKKKKVTGYTQVWAITGCSCQTHAYSHTCWSPTVPLTWPPKAEWVLLPGSFQHSLQLTSHILPRGIPTATPSPPPIHLSLHTQHSAHPTMLPESVLPKTGKWIRNQGKRFWCWLWGLEIHKMIILS